MGTNEDLGVICTICGDKGHRASRCKYRPGAQADRLALWNIALMIWLLIGGVLYATHAEADVGHNQGAKAHAEHHAKYHPWCCDMMDCTPMHKAEFRDGQWFYTNMYGNTAPVKPGYTKYFTSFDHQTHACVYNIGTTNSPNWVLRCLYIPGGN